MEGLEHLSDRYKVPLSKFKERLVKELGERIEAVVLYGSVAKGEAHDASDIDIMVIAKHVEHLRDAISSLRRTSNTVTSGPQWTELTTQLKLHLQPLLLHCGVDLALALGPPPHQHHPGPARSMCQFNRFQVV